MIKLLIIITCCIINITIFRGINMIIFHIISIMVGLMIHSIVFSVLILVYMISLTIDLISLIIDLISLMIDIIGLIMISFLIVMVFY